MQNHWETYSYVDASWSDPETKKRSPWIRCHLNNFTRFIVEPSRGMDCFASVQRYRDAARDTGAEAKPPPEPVVEEKAEPAPAHAAGEGFKKTNGHHHPAAEARDNPFDLPQRQVHYHGLFFDFDVVKAKRAQPREETLPDVQRDALALATYFLEGLELNPSHVQVWFSGSKGFHLIVRPEAFDLEPHPQLTYAVRHIAVELRTKLGLDNLDTSIYSVSRMWRVANTIHSSTGLYKIELTVNELARLPVPAILEMAKEPRYA